MAATAKIHAIGDALSEAVQMLAATFRPQSDKEVRNGGLLLAAVLCAILPLDISHLISLLVGMLAYLALQSLNPTVGPSQGPRRVGGSNPKKHSPPPPPVPAKGTPRVMPRPAAAAAAPPQTPELRRPSAMPVSAPTFRAVGWEGEAEELLGRLSATDEGEATVLQIARTVKKLIMPIFPQADVDSFACGSISGGTAFGVAVPEVDIVISVSSDALLGRLQSRWADSKPQPWRIDAWKLQKSAIRACTDRLVGAGNFKFRRSAFREPEPKVTIIAPGLRAGSQGVPVNLSVNAVTPLYSWALLSECGRMEPRAKDLVLLVKRWAKDRGLCHTAKGHLSPYAWSLLAIFFMQVAADEAPLLPPLGNFARAVRPANKADVAKILAAAAPHMGKGCTKTVGALFKDFVSFYANTFEWRREAASVRLGHRAAPETELSVPRHAVLADAGAGAELGPSIEDPFKRMNNLAACMTTASLSRLHEELARAESLATAGASLTRLLEPWAPAEVAHETELAERNAGFDYPEDEEMTAAGQ